ncbi:MAG: HDIG domain-containing protein [Clostridia bacterium]|nr:HDIG domain-containing protein [Clostridia bacterium]
MKYMNTEFGNIIKDILANETVQNLRCFKHHYGSNRYEHCLSVAYNSYKICKFLGLDHVSAARAGVLHDLFLYDCENPQTRPQNHITNHPKIALENAEKLFILNDIEKDIILRHMWPVTFSSPRYLETLVVTFVDKYCAIKEWSNYCKYSMWSWYLNWFYI